MYAGRLYMFHHPHDMKIIAIKNRINLRFLAAVQKMINQYPIARKML